MCIFFFKWELRWNCIQLSDIVHTSMVFMTLAFVTGRWWPPSWAASSADWSEHLWEKIIVMDVGGDWYFPELQVLSTFIAFLWDVLLQWDEHKMRFLSTWVSTSSPHLKIIKTISTLTLNLWRFFGYFFHKSCFFFPENEQRGRQTLNTVFFPHVCSHTSRKWICVRCQL